MGLGDQVVLKNVEAVQIRLVLWLVKVPQEFRRSLTPLRNPRRLGLEQMHKY